MVSEWHKEFVTRRIAPLISGYWQAMEHGNKLFAPLPKGERLNAPGCVAPFGKDQSLPAGHALPGTRTTLAEIMRIGKTGHQPQ
jgi:hypothetical protein